MRLSSSIVERDRRNLFAKSRRNSQCLALNLQLRELSQIQYHFYRYLESYSAVRSDLKMLVGYVNREEILIRRCDRNPNVKTLFYDRDNAVTAYNSALIIDFCRNFRRSSFFHTHSLFRSYTITCTKRSFCFFYGGSFITK